ncbi:MAG: hypothetical protein SFV15_10650 [Polyangiaceae bacterium]|nr:hypothetical protein [Polyangiaceae bacterium]
MTPNNSDEGVSNDTSPNSVVSEYVSDPRRYSDPDGNRELLRLRDEGLDPAALPLPEMDPPRAGDAPRRPLEELLVTHIRSALSTGQALSVEASGDMLTIRIPIASLEDKHQVEAILVASAERDRGSLPASPQKLHSNSS